MDDSIFFECVVKPPENYPRLKHRKQILILIYLAVCLMSVPLFFLVFGVIPGVKFTALLIPFVFVVAVFCFVLVRFTWLKTKPEYEYAIEDEQFTVSVIYAGRTRRVICRTNIRDASAIIPSGMSATKLKDLGEYELVRGVFSDEQINYYILTQSETGDNVVIALAATQPLVKNFKRINGRTVVSFG